MHLILTLLQLLALISTSCCFFVDELDSSSNSFGLQMKRRKVEIISEIPSVQDFFEQYVKTSRPVMLSKLYRDMKSRSDYTLKLGRMSKRGRSALTIMRVDDNEAGGHRLSLLKFSKRFLEKQETSLNSIYPLHFYLKTQLLMPKVLRCHDVLPRLRDTKHVLIKSKEKRHKLMKDRDHKIICQLEGEKEILLISPQNELNKRSQEELAKLDVNNVDFDLLPELKHLEEIQVARLSEGQCLFIPSEWIVQTNVLDLDHSIQLNWAPAAKPEDERDELKCERRVSPVMTIGDAAWPRERFEKRPDRTSDRERKAIDMMSNIVDKYLLSDKKNYDLDAVQGDMRSDGELTGGIAHWNDECLDVAKRVFELLDTNKNGRLDPGDVEGVEQMDVVHWAGAVMDEHYSFAEIGFDQKVDDAVPEEGLGSNSRLPHPEELIRAAEENELSEEREWAKHGKIELKKFGKNKDEL